MSHSFTQYFFSKMVLILIQELVIQLCNFLKKVVSMLRVITIKLPRSHKMNSHCLFRVMISNSATFSHKQYICNFLF